MGIGISRLQFQRFLALLYRIIDFPLLQQSAPEVVMRFGIIGMQPKRLSVLINRIVDVALFELDDAEVVVGHPTTCISGDRCSPKRFYVAIHRTLPPAQ